MCAQLVLRERVPVERLPVERLLLALLLADRLVLLAALRDEPELAFALELDFDALELAFDALELAFDREFVRDAAVAFCVSAARSLSKSLSACLFVFAASRRSAVIAAVTSL